MYEYFLHEEKTIFDQEQISASEDQVELDKLDEDDAWADQMEAEFEAEMKKEQDAIALKAKQKEEKEWMEKQIKEHNDEFGDDLSINFEE